MKRRCGMFYFTYFDARSKSDEGRCIMMCYGMFYFTYLAAHSESDVGRGAVVCSPTSFAYSGSDVGRGAAVCSTAHTSVLTSEVTSAEVLQYVLLHLTHCSLRSDVGRDAMGCSTFHLLRRSFPKCYAMFYFTYLEARTGSDSGRGAMGRAFLPTSVLTSEMTQVVVLWYVLFHLLRCLPHSLYSHCTHTLAWSKVIFLRCAGSLEHSP